MFAGVKGFFKSAIANAVDAYFNRTTLLLHGDGTNGAQNNTFLDSSSNNFTITRNGNATQGTFTPFSQSAGQWSNYFNGSTDYLLTAITGKSLGTGSFTLEAWIYAPASPVGLISSTRTVGGSDGTSFLISSQKIQITTSGTVLYTGTTTLNAGQWYHVAYVRNGSSACSVYINGVLDGTFTDSRNFSGTQLLIGGGEGGNAYFAGYISNYRITNTAVYTAAFTPPTSPLTSAYAILTCQSNRFVDNSSNNFTFTIGGSPSVQAFSPFAPTAAYSAATVGGSGYFDGSGDYLTLASNAAFQFSTGNFSLEFWTYPTALNAFRSYLSNRNGTETNRWGIDSNSSGQFYLYANNAYVATSSSTFASNQWVHVCVTRTSTTTNGVRLFVNGKLEAVSTSSLDLTVDVTSIGASPTGSQPSLGYMSGVRIVKGGIPSAYSTSSTTIGTQIFTPPTAPFTGSESLTAGSVSLICNFTNGGIFDQTGKNDLETVGNAQISTSVKKYGSGSLYFDGSSDGLPIADSPLWNFGSGDWTIEFWVYPTSYPNYACIISKRLTNAYQTPFNIDILSTGKLLAESWNSGTAIQITSNTTVSLNTWTHIAVVRNGTSFKMYFNGVADSVTGSYSAGATVLVNTHPVNIGQDGSTANSWFAGYLDDIRVSRYARYVANFTPPTAAFADQ